MRPAQPDQRQPDGQPPQLPSWRPPAVPEPLQGPSPLEVFANRDGSSIRQRRLCSWTAAAALYIAVWIHRARRPQHFAESHAVKYSSLPWSSPGAYLAVCQWVSRPHQGLLLAWLSLCRLFPHCWRQPVEQGVQHSLPVVPAVHASPGCSTVIWQWVSYNALAQVQCERMLLRLGIYQQHPLHTHNMFTVIQ